MNENFLKERALCPVFDKYAYLLTGSTGPIPTYVYDGMKDYMDRRLYEGGDAIFRGEGTFTMIARVRALFGELLGCPGDDIAFGPNSSAMFCIFTDGLSFEPGDNIVTSRDTFLTRGPNAFFSETPGYIHKAATLGQDTREVLSGLGYSEDEVARMMADWKPNADKV